MFLLAAAAVAFITHVGMQSAIGATHACKFSHHSLDGMLPAYLAGG